MISFLVLIPGSLLQDRLIPLLEILDLVRLDTAVSNQMFRPLLLEQLRGARLTSKSLPIDSQAAQWLLDRNIRISALLVSEKAIDLSKVKELVDSVDSISMVILDNCSIVTQAAVIDFIRACKIIKTFRLRKLCQGNAVLESIAQSCPALESIILANSKEISLDSFHKFTIGCERILDICLNDCFWLNDEFTAIIARNCPQLQELSLDYCRKCGDKTLQVLAEHCHDLRYVSVNGLHSLTDEGLGSLAAGCAELCTFLVDYSRNITTNGIIRLVKGCSKLEEIGMPGCDEQIDLAVAVLVQHCPALNTLHCTSYHFTDKSLGYLQNCPLLHTLELKGTNITIPALIILLNSGVNLFCLAVTAGISDIRIPLTIESSKVVSNFRSFSITDCMFLTDAEVIPLIAQCPNLTEIDLRGCYELTDETVLTVAAHCRELQSIHLDYLDVTDAAVCALVRSCPDLRKLRTCNCDELTDVTACAIAQHCSYLKHLDMSSCAEITDVGVIDILQRCRQLRDLKLSSCVAITTKVVEAALQHAKRLRGLDLRGCKVSYDAVTATRFAMP